MYSLIVALGAGGLPARDQGARRRRVVVVVGVALGHRRAGAHPLLGAVPRRGRRSCCWRCGCDRGRRVGRRLGCSVAMAIGCLAFVPWLPSFAYQAAHTGSPWAKPIRPSTILTITANDLGGVGSEGQVVGFVLTLLVLLALFGVAASTAHIDLDLHTVPQVRTELALVGLTVAFGVAHDLRHSGHVRVALRRGVRAVPAVGGGGRSHPLPRRLACDCAIVGVLVLGGLARWLPERDRRTDAARGRGRSGAERTCASPATSSCTALISSVLPATRHLRPTSSRSRIRRSVRLSASTGWTTRSATPLPIPTRSRRGARARRRPHDLVRLGRHVPHVRRAVRGAQLRVPAGSAHGPGARDRQRQQVLRARVAVRVPAVPVTVVEAGRGIRADLRAALPAWIAARVLVAVAYGIARLWREHAPSRRPHDPAPPRAVRLGRRVLPRHRESRATTRCPTRRCGSSLSIPCSGAASAGCSGATRGSPCC